MSRRIAVTMRTVAAPAYQEPRDAISHDWIRYLSSFGLIPLLIPNALPDAVELLRAQEPDALLLTNGEDVLPHAGPGDASAAASESCLREATERSLLAEAVARRLPVLGVCRGFQFINAYFGGTVRRHLANEPEIFDRHVGCDHRIEVRDVFAAVLRVQSLRVNSYHHHGVTLAGLGRDLIPCALARGNLVEAYRHRTLPIWGVQWHPERPNPAQEQDRALLHHWLAATRQPAL